MELWYERSESPGTRWSIRITRPLFSSEGKAGRIEVLETEDFGRVLSIGGSLVLTEGEGFAQREMLAHTPLNVHPGARSVLVVGALDCGLVAEVLRHPLVERLVLVEGDQVLLDAQKRFFPDLASGLSDPRARIVQEDAEAFARDCRDRFDVAIVQSWESSAASGLGQSFYCDCFRLLSGDGILVAPAGSPHYVAKRRELIGAAGKLKRLFPLYRLYSVGSPVAEGGSRLLGFASKKYDPLADFREESWVKEAIATRYYSADTHRAAFVLPPYLTEALAGC
jgi:Spermidine synthase